MALETTKHGEYRYFKLSEFHSPDINSGGEKMDVEFMQMLDDARHKSGVPYVVTSGYRTAAHNRAVRGARNSAHLRGKAADIRATSRTQFEAIVIGAVLAGFRRIGTAANFVHLDNDDSLPRTQWLYNANNAEEQRRLAFVQNTIRVVEFINNQKTQ